MIPLNARDKYTQGAFKPQHPEKYIGRETPVYRSGFELKFFRWADQCTNILEWSSESVIIPYLSPIDNKWHRYYVDGMVAIRENNKIVKYLIEIKPSNQLLPPVSSKRKKPSTILFENTQYIINQAKWKYAREWCVKKGFKFQLLTEKELGIK